MSFSHGDPETPPERACQDCGDDTQKRRTRCKACGKLVCRWCYNHVHHPALREAIDADD